MKTLLPIALILALFSGCTKNNSSSNVASAKTLNVYCWANYFSGEFVQAFEKQTGARVVFNYFSSNDELLAKLEAGARGYDIIVPSGYMLRAMKELKLIEPLGALDWPELKNLAGFIKENNYDPTFEYAVPYQSGTTGFAINRAKIKSGTIDSLSWLFDHPELKGQIGMLDDPPAVVGAAMKYLGYSYNENSDEAFAKVRALLLKQKKNLKMFSGDTIQILENGEVAITQAYSGDVLQARRKNPKIEYVLPKEGGELFIDYLAIPTGAPSKELAKQFIHLSLNQKIAAQQTMHLFYAPAVSLKGLSGTEILLKNKSIFPPDALMKKFEIHVDNPERNEKIQKLWTEIKSS